MVGGFVFVFNIYLFWQDLFFFFLQDYKWTVQWLYCYIEENVFCVNDQVPKGNSERKSTLPNPFFFSMYNPKLKEAG